MHSFARMERIAIAGADNSGIGAGNRIMAQLAATFPERIVPIHADGSKIHGIDALPSRNAFSDPIDLLISALPPQELLRLLRQVPPDRIRYLLALPDEAHAVGDGSQTLTKAIFTTAEEKGIQVIDPDLMTPPAHPLEALFQPQAIAIAGASNSEGKIGNQIMKRLMNGYGGKLYPIHPTAADVLGIPAVAKPSELQHPMDLLIALLPGQSLLPFIESCAPQQFQYLLAVPSGFGEVQGVGQELQDALVAAARQRGMRVVGPNCMGLLNAGFRLNASLVPDMPPGGPGVSILTQSGGFGIATTMYALDHNLPVAKICDLGNTCDLQPAELMSYLEQDRQTQVVGLLLESVGETDEFVSALNRLLRKKPVILYAPGKSEAGARASKSHLGLTPVSGIAQFIQDTGSVVTETSRELYHVAKSLMWQPMPRGRNVAIVTGTGGVGVELADLAHTYGLAVPELPEATQDTLKSILPDYAGVSNPIDLTPIYARYHEVYPKVCRLLQDVDDIDQIILSITDVATGLDDLAERLSAMMGVAEEITKPLYVFWGSRWDMVQNRMRLECARIPCFSTTLETIRTVSAITKYAEWRVRSGL